MARRSFLSTMIALPFLGMTASSEQITRKPLKIMMKSAWGSDDPTKSAFPFLHGLALSEAGHSVQIFLLAVRGSSQIILPKHVTLEML